MPARAATPLDLRRVSALLASSLREPSGIMASALPVPLAAGAVSTWTRLLPGLLGLNGRLRVFLEEYRGQLRSSALVYDGSRPEWVVLILAALQQPGGADSAFRLLSGISGAAARAGMHRFYAMTTPHAVQRAEQLSFSDFDLSRRGGAYDPPHLVGGNPLAMRRESALLEGEESRPRAFALSFSGLERHPHVCKVRTADGDVDLARDLLRATARGLPSGKPVTSPVRSYEEHVARALLAEGFREIATSMLFTKELAERVEERAFAPAV